MSENKFIFPISLRGFFALCCLSIACFSLMACKDEKAKAHEAALSYIHSAEAYVAQGQFRSAILEAKNAIQKKPDEVQAYKLLATIYNQLGAYSSTQQLLEPQISKMPALIPELAAAYVEQKKYHSAVKVLAGYETEKNNLKERIIKNKILARAYIYLGDKEQFMAASEALRGLGASAEDWALLQAENLFHDGRNIEAFTALDEVAENKNLTVKTLMYLAQFSLSQNQNSKAEEYLTRALNKLPESDLMVAEKASVLRLLVEVLNQEGRTADAYLYQKKLADNNPESNAAQERFNDAMTLFHAGKFAEAEKVLTAVREQFPQEKNTAILLGLVNFQQGDAQKANELFDQYLDLETATAPVIQMAAMAKFRVNQTDDALALLKRSAESQPEQPEILAAYGLALLDQNIKSAEAEKYLEKSLALNPKQVRLRLALAKRDFALNEKVQAMGQLQKAYTEQPADFLTQMAYFNALASSGKLDQIKSEIVDFKRNNPDSNRNLFLDAWLKMAAKDYSGAQQNLERLVGNKSATATNGLERIETYKTLSQVYVLTNQKQKAADTLKDLLRQYPDQVSVYADWLSLEQNLNRPKDVVNFLVDLEKRNQSWQPSVVLAQVYVAQASISEAIKHLEIALARDPGVDTVRQIAANLYYQQAMQFLKANQLADAKTKILKALDYAPSNMNYLASLVEMEIHAGRVDEAQKVLDQFSHSEDVAAERAYLQSLIRTQENKPEEALAFLKESWMKKPLPITAEAIYQTYYAAQQVEAQEKFVDDWIKKLPKSTRPYLLKALSEQGKKNYASAANLYESCLALEPDSLIALNNLAWVYHELKNPKALELGKRAYDLDQNNAAVIDTYATILFDNNQGEEAYPLFQKAALLEPKSVEIQKHLADAKKKLRK